SDSVNEYRYPSWAPDGKQFTVATWSPSGSAILVVELASGSRRQVLAADTVYLDCPQWSPKGTELLLTVYPSRVYPWKSSVTDARADLALFDFRSGRLRFVTTDHDKLNNYGRWSPDARWIVFQSDRHAPPFRAPATALATAAKVFIPIWLVAAGINMWVGVSKAGYSVAEEAPVFLVVFAVPAVVALVVLWRVSRG